MTNGGKQERAVVGAAEQFMRYGYQRTTMADIARAAGMSRPALYLLFPGKEQAFEAAVLHLNEIRMSEIESSLETCRTLREKLFTACKLWLVEVFALQFGNPDARDMDDLSFPVVATVYGRLQSRIARIIAQFDASPGPAEELARSLVFAVRGQGATAANPEEMLTLTRLQVDLFCDALASAGRRSDP